MGEKKEAVVNEELYSRFFGLVGSPEEGKRISQSKAAPAIGYSSGVISAYKSHTYNDNIAHNEADIAVIVGDAGGGKTAGAYQYQAESHSAFLVEVDPSFTKTTLLAEIARAIGVETKGTVTAVISRSVEALRERDAVLIIDEADYLSDACLELLR